MASAYEKEFDAYVYAPNRLSYETLPNQVNLGFAPDICPTCKGFLRNGMCQLCKVRRDVDITQKNIDRLNAKLRGKVGDECDSCGAVMWHKKENEKCKKCGKSPLSDSDFKYLKDSEKRLQDIKDTVKRRNISDMESIYYSMARRRNRKSSRKSTRRTRKSSRKSSKKSKKRVQRKSTKKSKKRTQRKSRK